MSVVDQTTTTHVVDAAHCVGTDGACRGNRGQLIDAHRTGTFGRSTIGSDVRN